MPQITLTLGREHLEDMRGIVGLLIDAAGTPEQPDDLVAEIQENLATAEPGVLLALADLSRTLLVLANREGDRQGGPHALIVTAVARAQAVRVDAEEEPDAPDAA